MSSQISIIQHGTVTSHDCLPATSHTNLSGNVKKLLPTIYIYVKSMYKDLLIFSLTPFFMMMCFRDEVNDAMSQNPQLSKVLALSSP